MLCVIIVYNGSYKLMLFIRMKEEDVIIPYVESASGKSCDMCPKNCTNSSCGKSKVLYLFAIHFFFQAFFRQR